MDIAHREREIATIRTRKVYKHIKYILDNTLASTSVQQLVIHFESLQICIKDWEIAQLKFERLIEPLNLEDEVNHACEIRIKLSEFCHIVEQAITDKRLAQAAQQPQASPITPPNLN